MAIPPDAPPAALQAAAACIAVLPFEHLSAEPAEAYFARGFVEDLAIELSRFPSFEVLHPDTVFATPADRDALVELGAGYCLRGTVRRTGDVVRVTAQLVEAGTGRQRWADRFEAPAAGLASVPDDIVGRVAAALAVEIDTARLARARRRPAATLEAYDCWLRGLEALHRGTLEDDAEARRFFEQAVAIDPTWARGHAGLSLSHFNEWSCQAWELWDEKERLAYEHAARAAALDDGDAHVQIVLGRILLYRREFDQAAHHVARALALSPNDADILAQVAMCLAYLGDATTGVELARKAIRLHPRHPDWYVACLVVPLFVEGRHQEVEVAGARAPRSTVDLPAYLAAAAALRGDDTASPRHLGVFLADFTDKITFGRRPDPGEPLRWIQHVNPFRDAERLAVLGGGLRLAGLPLDPDDERPRVHAGAPPGAGPALFRREGDVWTIGFDGAVVRLGEVKGFLDLAALLARPGEHFHCLELAGRGAGATGADPVLDERARRELRARVRDLQQEIDESEALGDPDRGARARAELDRLVEALAGALGLGGRARALGSPVERARSAVTWRIRSAIRKIAHAHPTLGRHLENAVRTGTSCAYQPERPVPWSL